MPCCDTCVCIGEPFDCLAATHPDEFGFLRAYCASDNPVWRSHSRARSKAGRSGARDAARARAGAMRERQAKTPDTPPIQAQHARSIPLAGDLVAALTARVGADRAAEWVASKLGKDCGCAARREKLNRLDQSVRKFLGIGG